MTAGYDEVFIEHAGAVSTVTINRPQRRNAVDVRALEALTLLLEGAIARPQTRVVVLRGAGGAFCAGADLPELPDGGLEPEGGDPAGNGLPPMDHGLTLRLISRIITAITSARVPVIGVVDGPAAGVGASFAFACDLVLASRPSFFLLPFAGIGLIPDGGATLTVAASIGRARALRLAMLGERLSADDALAMGLIAAVCEREDIDAEADALAERLAGGATFALARTKQLINECTMPGLASALDAEAASQVPLLHADEHAEGVRAFRERRPANFAHFGEDSAS